MKSVVKGLCLVAVFSTSNQFGNIYGMSMGNTYQRTEDTEEIKDVESAYTEVTNIRTQIIEIENQMAEKNAEIKGTQGDEQERLIQELNELLAENNEQYIKLSDAVSEFIDLYLELSDDEKGVNTKEKFKNAFEKEVEMDCPLALMKKGLEEARGQNGG
jgi:hypothetical protein